MDDEPDAQMPENSGKMKEIPQHVSESVKKLNPHLYGVGGLETQKPEPTPARALVSANAKCAGSKKGMVVVTLIAYRKRLLDDDNCVASFKPLRDGIAETLGVDDGSKAVSWQYSQILSKGREGVVVTIERIA